MKGNEEKARAAGCDHFVTNPMARCRFCAHPEQPRRSRKETSCPYFGSAFTVLNCEACLRDGSAPLIRNRLFRSAILVRSFTNSCPAERRSRQWRSVPHCGVMEAPVEHKHHEQVNRK